MEIETKRVKQNPFVAYPRMLAHMLVPKSAYERIKPRASARMPDLRKDWSFSTSDFKIPASALRGCITLVAICVRQASENGNNVQAF
jgi:hypothetical protein